MDQNVYVKYLQTKAAIFYIVVNLKVIKYWFEGASFLVSIIYMKRD